MPSVHGHWIRRDIVYSLVLADVCATIIQACSRQNAVSRATHSSTTIAAPFSYSFCSSGTSRGIKGTGSPQAVGTAP